MNEPTEKPSLLQYALVTVVMALIIAVLLTIGAVVMAAMYGIAGLSHIHLSVIPPWAKAAILVVGLGLTVWTTWSLDPVITRSWRDLALKTVPLTVYAVFAGSLNLSSMESPGLQFGVPLLIFCSLMHFDLWFRSEPRVLRLRDRLRGEAAEHTGHGADARG